MSPRAACRLEALGYDVYGCDDRCGCRADPDSRSQSTWQSLIPLTGSASTEIACSLQPDQVGGRIDDWNRVLASAKTREPIPRGVRVGFDRDVDIAALAELAAAEQGCCSFFQFTIGLAERVWLGVTGPEDAGGVIASMFGAAAWPVGASSPSTSTTTTTTREASI